MEASTSSLCSFDKKKNRNLISESAEQTQNSNSLHKRTNIVSD